jgi:four helix bundle protein
MNKDGVGSILSRQLLRSGTSIGANVHEAQGGQSRADFIAKMSIAHKEALETAYWLRLVRESDMIRADRVVALADEVDQLTRILSRILLTSKNRSKTVG